MYFQFLVEDQSTEIIVKHVMEKLKDSLGQKKTQDSELYYDIKSFRGIGHLKKRGSIQERKTGMLLNDLPAILRGMGKVLQNMEHAAIIIVMDNDKNDPKVLISDLEKMSLTHLVLVDHEFCLAIKELEAWILGDEAAIEAAYPNFKRSALRDYVQDDICDTWEVLANAVYPGGLSALKKKAAGSYAEIGRAKCEWADKVGSKMSLDGNKSPSFQRFITCLKRRIGVA